ncbi:MAG: ATP-dependent DNA helicase RecG [Anaerovoracaceae bacterium]
MNGKDQVTTLKGLGPKKAAVLEKLNIIKIEDLLCFFPRDYQDRRTFTSIDKLTQGRPALVRGRVKSLVQDGYHKKGRQILRLLIDDHGHQMEVVFFHGKYLSKVFKLGNTYDFYGVPCKNNGKMQMVHPDFSTPENREMGILPIYSLTSGISQREIRRWQKTIIEECEPLIDYMPSEVIERQNLCSLENAINNVHFPKEKSRLLEGKYRLIFDELLTLQLGLLGAKATMTDKAGGIIFDKKVKIDDYISNLPYSLTKAQKKVVKEIDENITSGQMMNRLVQGDVGSGKTVVAQIALYKGIKSGFQGVLMAPTEILAKQHYADLKDGFKPYGIEVGLLVGSMSSKEKKTVLDELKEGKIHILVGTHAIIQPNVRFKNLGLVITDEQHRFGVNQRALLSEKGNHPHILVMTATPIPRTLAVIIYGDLDVSIIDELPPGRQKIITQTIENSRRDQCYDFVEKEVEKGRQAYVVTPLIGESEVLDVLSAEEVFHELKSKFKGKSVELIHGEIKAKEKNKIMERFYEGEINILVSTVVIEVGINVPNATMMVIENAERFGLAQLHQLRGRVGRGSYQSYCILVSKNNTEVAKARSKIMVESQDGFYIAEKDLEIRGPGELFGTRQHGIPDLNLADLVKHIDILTKARDEAMAIIKADPLLKDKKHEGLKDKVENFFGEDFAFKL